MVPLLLVRWRVLGRWRLLGDHSCGVAGARRGGPRGGGGAAWCPANAALFPTRRARAAMLVRVGRALAHRHGGATAQLCELWLSA